MPHPRHVLITGASTGIGRACTLELAHLGFVVFAGVRKEGDGVALAAEGNGGIHPVILDVTDAASIAASISHITPIIGDHGLAGVINNAGISVVGPVEFVSLADWRRQFEVNFFGAITVAQAALPLLRMHAAKYGKGSARLINISSIAGKIAQPILGPYTASKHAMESLSDSMRMELAAQGIIVCSVNPGAIDTPIWGKAHAAVGDIGADHPARMLYGGLIDGVTAAAKKAQAAAAPASAVADAVVECLNARKPRTRYFVGRDAKMMARVKWLLPDWVFDGILATYLRKGK
jgi:NAD(P)-dependent dehydrogenase (short-subunit alcohol dehydrogenase family)